MHCAARPVLAGHQLNPSEASHRELFQRDERTDQGTAHRTRRSRHRAAEPGAWGAAKRRRVGACALGLAVAFVVAALPRPARADAYGITHPGKHIDYAFELEPEVILRFDRAFRDGPGLGVRGSVPILFNGFVSTINNSVAITFGLDKDPFADGKDYYVPVGLQWTFWLHRNFSVFGEPGVLFASTDRAHAYPQLWGGARVHFTDFLSLTGRISLPSSPGVGLGISFFL